MASPLPNQPTKYGGTQQPLVPTVTVNRAPTGADIRNPKTGKLYPIATIWQVGKNPTTGAEGDIWFLSKIVANVAYWVQLGTNNADLHITPYIVSPDGSIAGANYTTIQSALDAANLAGGIQTVYLQDATYVENLTMYAGVNMSSLGGNALSRTCVIQGKITCSYNGSAAISGVCLQTNGDFSLDITGSNAVKLRLLNCFFNPINTVGIKFDNTNLSTSFYLNYCYGDLGGPGAAYFIKTTGGKLKFYGCSFVNDGSSSTNSVITAAGLDFNNSLFVSTIDNSAAQIVCGRSVLGGLNQTGTASGGISNSSISIVTLSNTASFTCQNSTLGTITLSDSSSLSMFHCKLTSITMSGTTNAACYNSYFFGESSPCATIGIGGRLVLGNCVINSSNTNVITGLGECAFSGCTFPLSNLISSTIQTPFAMSNNAETVVTPSVFPYTVQSQDRNIAVNTASSAQTVLLTATPTPGQKVTIFDVSANASVNNITVSGNGNNILTNMTVASTSITTNGGGLTLLAIEPTLWKTI